MTVISRIQFLHPSKKIPKTYHVKIKGIIEDEKIEKLRRGIRLKDGVTAPAKVNETQKGRGKLLD